MLLLSTVACGQNTKADDFDTKLYDNMSIEEKNTALMEASSDGHFDIVKYLVDAAGTQSEGADVNAVNNEDTTALMMASYSGYTEIVKLLEDATSVNRSTEE